MPSLSPDQVNNLLDLMIELPSTIGRGQRDALLFSLPQRIVASVNRSDSQDADLSAIIVAMEHWGQLADGRWSTDVMLRNAIRSSTGSHFQSKLEAFREIFNLYVPDIDVPSVEELVTGEINYLMPVGFLFEGYRASRSVARLQVMRVLNDAPDFRGKTRRSGLGTGWLITPTLLMTNHHVIEARFKEDIRPARAEDIEAQALETVAWFDYTEQDGPYIERNIVKLEHLDRTLDYALLRLSEPVEDIVSENAATFRRGLTIVPETDTDWKQKGVPLNIIQHPGGQPQQIAVRRNDLIGDANKAEHFWYLTDTMRGSSGSPICNDMWQVVGLHHAARELPEQVQMKGEVIKYNNEGIFIHSILKNLPAEIRMEIADNPV